MPAYAIPGSARRLVRATLVVGSCAIAIAVTGCGSSNSSSSNSSSAAVAGAAPAAAKPTTLAGTPPGAGVTDFQKYIGGKPGKATGNPITIGFVTTQGGQLSFPETTADAQAAVNFINARLGGVDGRPLQLKRCFIAVEQDGQTCAQQFANDGALPLVVEGQLAIGDQSYDAQMKGAKLSIGSVAADPVDFTAANTYFLSGSSAQFAPPFATYVKKVVGGHSLSYLYNSVPALIPVAQLQAQQMRANGVTVKLVGYASAGQSLVGPLTSAAQASAIFAFVNTPDCVNVVRALQSAAIKTPIVATGQCLQPSVAQGLGDLPHWTYGLSQTLPSDVSDPTVSAYQHAVAPFGLNAKAASAPLGASTFSSVLFAARLLNQEGANAPTAKLAAAVKSYRGPVIMGPPNVHCGINPKIPDSCNDQLLFYRYAGKGKFVRASNWLGPQAG